MDGPTITDEEWRDEFAVVHKPARFFKRHELSVAFGSSAHIVITDQDLIASGAPEVLESDGDLDASRTTSALGVLGASAILALSERSRHEIALELGIREEEITVALGGVDRVEANCPEISAQSTFEVYRSAVLRPRASALDTRRMLGEAILRWSRPASDALLSPLFLDDSLPHDQPVGVRTAWKALNAAFQRRAGREMRRFHLIKARKGA